MSLVTTRPPGPTTWASSSALYPPEPASHTTAPGSGSRPSIMSACSHAADTELVARPASSRRVTMATSPASYAVFRFFSGAKRCLGTVRSASWTDPEEAQPPSMTVAAIA